MRSDIALWTTSVTLPLAYAVVFAIGFTRAWRAIPRLVPTDHACRQCSYSKQGLPVGAPCPECGNT
jgi:hypothetical protein